MKLRSVSSKLNSLLKSAPHTPFPGYIEPMLATLVSEPVDKEGWIYEMKWDGFRATAYLNNGRVDLYSRNKKSFNEKFYPLYRLLQQWKVNAIIDGEVVAVNDNGIPDFGALQSWRSEADGPLFFYVFDILWYNGQSLTDLPLNNRKSILHALIPGDQNLIRFSSSIEGSATAVFQQASELHLEGIMAKSSTSKYIPGHRSRDWLKIKTEKRQEMIIGGYTINEGTSKLFSALLMGIIENGKFNYLATVGTGFNKTLQQEIIKKLKPHQTKTSQFATLPPINKPSRFRPDPPKADVVWVKPVVVGEVSYRELTKDGSFRHPSFKGIREDKSAKEIKRELPADTASILPSHTLVKNKVLRAPGKKERKSLLNPKEKSQTRIIGGNELGFSNLDKIYWPKEGFTKRDLINYYYAVAPYILPYIKNKPQTLNRHPNGIEGKTFYQKDVKGKAPAWIETYPYFSYADNREKEFLVCTNEASLLYIASLGCIEINPWHSKTTNPENPDWCIIDLDPDKNSFNQVIEAALVTKKILDAVGVKSYPKTSGSTGLHIYIPLGAKYSYHDSKEFARIIARLVHEELLSYTTVERKTADRGGKMYIDFLQNRPQATVAAPYSLRPKPGAPVSMPLHWDEVKKGLKITDHNITNAIARLKETGDIFKPVLGKGINLPQVLKKIEKLFD